VKQVQQNVNKNHELFFIFYSRPIVRDIMIVLFGLRENDGSHSTVATQIERLR